MILSTRQNHQIAFSKFVDELTLSAVHHGITTFAGLLHRLPSVYPTQLLTSLDRLLDQGAVANSLVASIRGEATACPGDLPEGRSLLPLPHPLDFEWRFTPDASRDLLNIATDLTPLTGNVLMFGTPGLAVEALSLPTSRALSFLGEENIVTRRLIALNSATGSPLSIAFCSGGLPRDSADAVILDPPWYMDFIRPMLTAAAMATRIGGVVLVSLPPAGTRPSADSDREATIRLAGRLGLDLVEHLPLAIAYDTPFFEANALTAAGIYAPPRWRRGDLMILRKLRRSSRAPALSSGRRHGWVEVPVGRMRLFIKPDGRADAKSGLLGLIPHLEGDVLPTVSRRDRRRSAARVWTSGNRVYRSDNPALVLEAALSHSGERIGSGVQPRLWGTVREREAVERIGQELIDLAALEANEELGGPAVASKRSTSWISSSTSFWNMSTATVSG